MPPTGPAINDLPPDQSACSGNAAALEPGPADSIRKSLPDGSSLWCALRSSSRPAANDQTLEIMTTTEPISEPNGEFITKDDVANLLSVSKRTVSELMAARKLPFYRLNARLVRFHRKDVLDYLEQNFRVQGREV
jgi:excisionase family DNA binding protein